ncbi:oligosaccharide flippase family protein [Tsukamurella sp. 8F]|uniref:oligosaccharide flippase family protein n=1 Tax=unclassified Tsukamurella TaxID=2633480 RepID=UPI0023B98CE9|nr:MULTISPECIES: oligosaccharide flippase family protein [unclassified Tsukamurella]MDF0530675.1 oligosaccharide flippase family protein [Tsukamurella sp. 8J]MDF0587876.1 oligosaccharide flippase family protein [Tsukamurella sp. 8F]
MSETLTKRAASGALWLGLTNVCSKGMQMVVTVVLAATLTQADLGRVTVAVALVNVSQVIQSMGVFDVLARTDRDPKRMAGTVMSISVAVGALVAFVAVVFSHRVASLLGAPDAAGLVALTALSLPFTAVGGVQMAVMHRTLDFRRRVLPDAGSAIIGGIVTVVLAVTGAGPYSLALGLLTTAVLQPILGMFVGVRIVPAWDPAAAGEALRWVRVVGPAAVAGILLVNIDYPTVAHVLGADALGVYSLAFRIAWIPYIMGAVVLGAVAFPVYTHMIRDGRRDELPGASAMFTRAVIVGVCGMYVLIALLAHRVVVLNPRWVDAEPVLLVLCGYGIAISLLHTWYETAMAAGQARWYLVLELVRLVLLAGGLLALTRFGVVWAAVAQLAAAAVLVPFAWLGMARSGAAPSPADFGRALWGLAVPSAAAAAVSAAYRLSPLAGADGSVVRGVAEGLLVTAVFAAVAYLTNRELIGQLRSQRSEAAE